MPERPGGAGATKRSVARDLEAALDSTQIDEGTYAKHAGGFGERSPRGQVESRLSGVVADSVERAKKGSMTAQRRCLLRKQTDP